MVNLFKKRKTVDHKYYHDLAFEARKSSDDPLMQYKHFKQLVENHENQYQFLTRFLAEVAQYEISSIRSKEITFTTDCVENMWRSVIDLLKHLERRDIPEGVYEYNYRRLKWFAEECLQFAHKKYTDQHESQGSVKQNEREGSA
jgi:hypothetical protein